jgi:hypothetical protein
MKHFKYAASGLLVAIAFSFVLSSCKKGEEDAGIPPIIAFKTGGSYISSDTTLPQNTAFVVGITAEKSEGIDILKTFSASKSFNGGAETNVLSEVLTAAQGNNYSKDINITTGNQAGEEVYKFMVTNKDGHSNSVQLKVTVQ